MRRRASSASSSDVDETSAALLLATHAQPSAILPWLFVAGAAAAADGAALALLGVGLVVNCAGEVVDNAFEAAPLASGARVSYVTLRLRDGPFEDIASLFPLVCAAVEAARRAGAATLLHCHQGVSRSASFAIAYVMWAGHGVPLAFAHAIVRARRPIISPNAGFLCQLVEWGELIGMCARAGAREGVVGEDQTSLCSHTEGTVSLGSVREGALEVGNSGPSREAKGALPAAAKSADAAALAPLLFRVCDIESRCVQSGPLFGLAAGIRRPISKVLSLARSDVDRSIVRPSLAAVTATAISGLELLPREPDEPWVVLEECVGCTAPCSVVFSPTSDERERSEIDIAVSEALSLYSTLSAPVISRLCDVRFALFAEGGAAVLARVAARRLEAGSAFSVSAWEVIAMSAAQALDDSERAAFASDAGSLMGALPISRAELDWRLERTIVSDSNDAAALWLRLNTLGASPEVSSFATPLPPAQEGCANVPESRACTPVTSLPLSSPRAAVPRLSLALAPGYAPFLPLPAPSIQSSAVTPTSSIDVSNASALESPVSNM